MKSYKEVGFITFDKFGRGLDLKDSIEINTSCILGPFTAGFTWQTTMIEEIQEEIKNETGNLIFARFKTKNSNYTLEWRTTLRA
jgi:hypothetical protein